jgi:endogenous inhibitor of DNA gyrase (YacG/DUF329 family)
MNRYTRRCLYCGREIPWRKRNDALFCSVHCKDQHHNRIRSRTYTITKLCKTLEEVEPVTFEQEKALLTAARGLIERLDTRPLSVGRFLPPPPAAATLSGERAHVLGSHEVLHTEPHIKEETIKEETWCCPACLEVISHTPFPAPERCPRCGASLARGLVPGAIE